MSEQEDFESLARRLEAADFSADSRVRASLRAELLSRRRSPRLAGARVAGLALAVAAAAMLVVLPLRSRHPYPPAEAPRTARVAETPPAPLPAPRRAPYPRGAHGLPVLPGYLAATGTPEPSPLSSRAIDHVIEVRRGRTVRGKDRIAVVFEFEGAAYRFETRRITQEDLRL